MHMLYYRTVIGGEPRCQDAAVAQSVVRRIGSAEVTGPIPVSSSDEITEILILTGFPLFCVSIIRQTIPETAHPEEPVPLDSSPLSHGPAFLYQSKEEILLCANP